jgi:hypothetical protein
VITPVWRRRLVFLCAVAAVYFAGTLGLAWAIGVYFNPVRCVLFGAVLLAGWLAARWVSGLLLARTGRARR